MRHRGKRYRPTRTATTVTVVTAVIRVTDGTVQTRRANLGVVKYTRSNGRVGRSKNNPNKWDVLRDDSTLRRCVLRTTFKTIRIFFPIPAGFVARVSNTKKFGYRSSVRSCRALRSTGSFRRVLRDSVLLIIVIILLRGRSFSILIYQHGYRCTISVRPLEKIEISCSGQPRYETPGRTVRYPSVKFVFTFCFLELSPTYYVVKRDF